MRKRALFLVNRGARSGAADVGRLLEVLRDAGIDAVEEPVRNPRTLPGVVLRYKDEVDLVVVAGGDGTLNAAADGLVRAGRPVGVVPLGTANDLARTLGLPADPAAACGVIAAGRTRRIDLGRVNGKHFFNVASVGLSVEVTDRLSAAAKRRWGTFAYLVAALGAMARARPFRAEIEAAGATYRVRTLQVAVGNGRHYGGGMTVAADAAIDDGRLDLYSLEVRHAWQVLFLLRALRSGTLSGSKYVRTLRGREFRVTPRRPRPVNTDGEVTDRTPAVFTVARAALEVFVPAPTGTPSGAG